MIVKMRFENEICLGISGRRSGTRILLLVHKKMLSQASWQRWQERKRCSGFKGCTATRWHVQRQGSLIGVPCHKLVTRGSLFYPRGIHFDMRRYSRIWKNLRTTLKSRTRLRANRARSNSGDSNTR